MKKTLSLLIIICMLLSGCTTENNSASNEDDSDINTNIEKVNDKEENNIEISFDGPNDPKLITYIENDIYSNIINTVNSEDYFIENVQAVYLSDEYVEEMTYNSKENIFFGYTLKELDNQFGEKRYCFTLGNDGTTIVQEFTGHDDSTERMIKNVAIGTGVIVVCVVVTYATAGAAAGTALHTVNMMFSMAAADSVKFAALGAPIGAIAGGVTEAIRNDDSDISDILKSSLLGATEGYKIGAIVGAAEGAARSAISQYASNLETTKAIEAELNNSQRTFWRKSELRTLLEYGGEEQKSYLAGEIVELGTPGSTRPDIVRYVGNKLEAIEVKNYNLNSIDCVDGMIRELKREVSDRIINLPSGSLQRIVLDVTDRGFSKELVESVSARIVESLASIYLDIPIDIVGL